MGGTGYVWALWLCCSVRCGCDCALGITVGIQGFISYSSVFLVGIEGSGRGRRVSAHLLVKEGGVLAILRLPSPLHALLCPSLGPGRLSPRLASGPPWVSASGRRWREVRGREKGARWVSSCSPFLLWCFPRSSSFCPCVTLCPAGQVVSIVPAPLSALRVGIVSHCCFCKQSLHQNHGFDCSCHSAG